jgi:hypothetical protein
MISWLFGGFLGVRQGYKFDFHVNDAPMLRALLYPVLALVESYF